MCYFEYVIIDGECWDNFVWCYYGDVLVYECIIVVNLYIVIMLVLLLGVWLNILVISVM